MDNNKKDDVVISDLPIAQITFITALIKARGNVSKACKAAEMPRSTYYLWMKNDERFVNALQEAKETLEEELFEQVYGFGFNGDITAAIFSLKSLNREKYDDAFARQKYLLEKGATPYDAPLVQSRIILVREPEPERLQKSKESELHGFEN